MSSRDRKRAERRKRKERSASGEEVAPVPGDAGSEEAADAATLGAGYETSATPGDNGSGDDTVEDIAAAAEARGPSRSEIRNQEARDKLEPLAEGERPRIVTVGALVSFAIAASILIGYAAGVEVDVENSTADERPNPFQVFPPAVLFTIMGIGMWRARYWAVLGFEAIMAILMVGSFITLIASTSAFQAITAGAVLVAAALLFWFTVKALARIQMPAPGGR